MKQIYLSGPIAGLTYSEATTWRDHVGGRLYRAGIEPLDPMRSKTFKTDTVRLSPAVSEPNAVVTLDQSMITDRGITARDYNDTINSDLVFVNLLGAPTVSIGTVIEIAWAYDHRIPVVVAMEPTANPHEHPMLREMISFRVDDLDRAVDVALSVLNVETSYD
jgi:hypothetical protein